MNQLLEDLVQSKTRERGQPSKGLTSKLRQRQSSHSVSQEEIHDKGSNSDLSAENSPKKHSGVLLSRRSSHSESSQASSQLTRRVLGKPPLKRVASSPCQSAVKQPKVAEEEDEYHPSFPLELDTASERGKRSGRGSFHSETSDNRSMTYAKQLDAAYHEIIDSRHRHRSEEAETSQSQNIVQTFANWDASQAFEEPKLPIDRLRQQAYMGAPFLDTQTQDRAGTATSTAEYLTLSQDPDSSNNNGSSSGLRQAVSTGWSPMGASVQASHRDPKEYSSGTTRAETASQNKGVGRSEAVTPNVFNFDSYHSKHSEYQSGKFGPSDATLAQGHIPHADPAKMPTYEPLSKTLLEKINLRIPGASPLGSSSSQNKPNNAKEWSSLGMGNNQSQHDVSGANSSAYLSQGKPSQDLSSSVQPVSSARYSSLQTAPGFGQSMQNLSKQHASHPDTDADPSTEYYVALYSFEGEKAKDLSFRKGELVRVIKKTPLGWWLAQIDHRIGQVPSNFLGIPRPEDLAAAEPSRGVSDRNQ